MADDKPMGRFSAAKAVFVGIAGTLAGLISFTEQGQKLFQFVIGQLPDNFTTDLPFGEVRRDSDRLDTILANRYLTNSAIEDLCGKPIAERTTDKIGNKRIESVYKSNIGLVYVNRNNDIIENLVLVPRYNIRTVVRELGGIGLNPPYSLASIKKAFPNSPYFVIESAESKIMMILVMDLPMYGSNKAAIKFIFGGGLDCGELGWLGMDGGMKISDLECKNLELKGKLSSIVIIRSNQVFASDYRGVFDKYSEVFTQSGKISDEFTRYLNIK
ncbi:hypothetical protein [Methylobacterium sp. 22177]|uniref:hypothetical protein n=1 Tax=Methylobacterium sp. 22177 TaxID=3453885 RepID=UPI003F83424A